MFVITAYVRKDYGHANAIIGVTETREKAEELIDSISTPGYPFCFQDIDEYGVGIPKIIEVEELNTLCVCLDSDGLDYSDS